MKKALVTATTPYMFRQFLEDDLKTLKDLGYIVEIGTNYKTFNVMSDEALRSLSSFLEMEHIKINQISFTNKVFDLKNLVRSYFETKSLMNENKYDLIHTHTPIAGFITRLAYRSSNVFPSSKMLYTAHGFHFYKGNNVIKNAIFYSIEKMAAKYTDIIITMNEEDYHSARKFTLKNNGTVDFIPGVGIDLSKIQNAKGNKEKLCKEISVPDSSVLIVSVGELRKRKNHEAVIRIMPNLPDNYHYIICGSGNLKDELINLANQLNVNDRVHLLGFRTNVIETVKSCDLFVFPSLQEGLPVALMEAMASGIPCIASNIRGNYDLLKNYSQCLFSLENLDELKQKIMSMIQTPVSFRDEDIMQYDKANVDNIMRSIYIKSQNDFWNFCF